MSGVDSDHRFYKEAYKLSYPAMKQVVAEVGMKDVINSDFLLFRNPRNPALFSPTFNDLEVLTKSAESFKVKQTADIKNQHGRQTYIYIVDFVKEDGNWKFAGAERQD